jgi:aryl-alcohol dehydrogenase-like predicted oxidoreductase
MSNLLPTTAFGKTGLQVSRLGFGAMEIRGTRIWGGRPASEEQAQTILNAVLDAGINFIDTANDYGRSEELIGKTIAHRRGEYYLATKCGCKVTRRDDHSDDTPHVWTKENLYRGLHESLQRMKTEVIDFMQLHNPPVEECVKGNLVEVMQEMRAQGKVRHIGISTTLPHLPTYMGVSTFQIPYSALDEHEIGSLSPLGGIGTIIRGGVARGEPGAGLGQENRWQYFEKAKLDELRASGESRTSFLLRFTLSHPHVHTIIAGTLNPEHLKENIDAINHGPLSPEIYIEAKRRLVDIGLKPA